MLLGNVGLLRRVDQFESFTASARLVFDDALESGFGPINRALKSSKKLLT
jgi:hypothetical protein